MQQQNLINIGDFNLTAQDDKGRIYNSIAKVLNPIHKMAGANTSMQTRSKWEIIIKK
jgi:hypothetical protein